MSTSMHFLIIIIQFSLITCNLNITDTSNKIKFILNRYKTNIKCSRHSRCLKTEKINDFVGKTLNFFDKTERYGDFFRHLNISECDNANSGSYKREHILKGLLVHDNVPETHWHEYKAVHQKEYSSIHHEMAALKKWRENLKLVAEHNRQYLSGEISYSLHLNHLGDLTNPTHFVDNSTSKGRDPLDVELGKTYLHTFHKHSVADYFRKILKLFPTVPLFDPAEDRHKTAYRKMLKKRVPEKVDWRQRGFKPRREDQSKCGACYAFAVTHALQAQMFRKHKNWGEFRYSELQEGGSQVIVDCSHNDGNMGCEGGSIRAAIRYVARSGLIMEKNYPYTGKRGHCKYKRNLISVKPRRWAMLPPGDEEAMERALATIGPLAVGVNAAPFTFQFYRSGIYDDPFCLPWQLNHAMLLVGYTPDYWILLNWWGESWGEDGYMRIRRGFNRCGVANMAAYVEL